MAVKRTASGRSSGMPVTVEAFFDGEEWQCYGCMRRFTAESFLICHVVDKHRYLIKGGNPLREEG